MHQHEHDENNAPNQAKSAKPADPDAHLANGVPVLSRLWNKKAHTQETGTRLRPAISRFMRPLTSVSGKWASKELFKRC